MRAALMHFLRLIRCAGAHWAADSAGTLGAALAFYSAFSLAPLLVILVTVAGVFIGGEAAYQQLGSQLHALFGAATARVLLNAMQASQQGEGTLATVVGSVTLMIGATTALAAVRASIEQRFAALVILTRSGEVMGRVSRFATRLWQAAPPCSDPCRPRLHSC